jgi:phosphoesterase RecJ-like protein
MKQYEIADILRNNRRFIIAGHVNPDGDSIGACMGLALALAKMGKDPVVVLEEFPEKYNIIPGRQFLWKKGTQPLDDGDVFVAIDCASPDRIGLVKDLLDTIPVTICIDHHETNEGFALYNWIDGYASSSCEMVFDLISPLVELDSDIASAIYAGVVFDTGGFRFSLTDSATLIKIAQMMETGIPFTKIYSEILSNHSFAAAKALGIVIQNIKQSLDGLIIYSHITLAEMAKIDATPDDLDGVVEYLIRTNGAEVAVFLYEKSKTPEVKISLRSHGFHVGRFAVKWGGGGHHMAAGISVNTPISETLPLVLADLEKDLQNT